MLQRLALPAFVLALGLAWVVSRPTVERGAPLSPEAPRGLDVAGAAALTAPTARAPAAAPAPVTEVDPPAIVGADPGRAAARGWTVRGRALDSEGRPVPGAGLVALPRGSHAAAYGAWQAAARRARQASAPAAALTAADGSFALPLHGPQALVFADDPHWTTLFAGNGASHAADQEVIVVLAPPIAVAGHVVDETGAPVSGTSLALHDELAPGLPGFPLSLARSLRVAWTWASDRTGAFELTGFAALPRRRVDLTRDGYDRAVFWPGAEGRQDWLIVQRRMPEVDASVVGLWGEPVLFGRVVAADGAPIAGAEVVLATSGDRTDELGRFEFERAGWIPNGAALIARAPDGRYAVERDEARWTGGGARIGPLELVVAGGTRTVPGRVVDPRGAPLAGWRVGLVDATVFDTTREPWRSLERGLEADAHWPLTDAEGAFRLSALAGRDYRVCALDSRTLESVEAHLARDAAELVIVVPEGGLVAALEGCVVDALGRPVHGAAVTRAVFAERYGITPFEDLERTTSTDSEGRFRMERVPRAGLSLTVSGPALTTRGVAPSDAELDAGRVELTVERGVLVRVDVAEVAPDADTAEFLDGDGRRLLARHPGVEHSQHPEAALHGGRSGVLVLPPSVRGVVLRRGGAEVRRLGFEPSVDGVTVVGRVGG